MLNSREIAAYLKKLDRDIAVLQRTCVVLENRINTVDNRLDDKERMLPRAKATKADLDRDIETLVGLALTKKLRGSGIKTVRDLVYRSEASVLCIRGLGIKALLHLKFVLYDIGLRMGMPDEEIEAIECASPTSTTSAGS